MARTQALAVALMGGVLCVYVYNMERLKRDADAARDEAQTPPAASKTF
jgi:hypothetical protein